MFLEYPFLEMTCLPTTLSFLSARYSGLDIVLLALYTLPAQDGLVDGVLLAP